LDAITGFPLKRLDGSQMNANSIIDRRTPKPGALVRVKCGHVVVNARVGLVVERTDVDWVNAEEVE
jgi:hypothetical protein